jgi:hypothetical protein
MKIIALAFVFLLHFYGAAQMRMLDKLRIREAQQIMLANGEKIWKGIDKVPFTLLFLTDSGEYLVHHPAPSADFKNLGYDSVLRSTVYWRANQYNKGFLATFPAVNGRHCMVVGTPENTHRTTTQWIITLLHEHFHLYTYSRPGYTPAVNQLDLAGKDSTGMWMLNYPFPYKEAAVEAAYERYTAALHRAVTGTGSFGKRLKQYKKARKEFKKGLTAKDYRYFSFQLWQEGLARYTEYKYLEALDAAAYEAPAAIRHIEDFTAYGVYKKQLYDAEMQQLVRLQLKDAQRVCFYAAGFAEGLLLDQLRPGWRSQAEAKRFFVEHY